MSGRSSVIGGIAVSLAVLLAFVAMSSRGDAKDSNVEADGTTVDGANDGTSIGSGHSLFLRHGHRSTGRELCGRRMGAICWGGTLGEGHLAGSQGG
jgi:hypothetical protein